MPLAPGPSSESLQGRNAREVGRDAAAHYGDLIARLWVCGSRRGSAMTLLCPQVRLIGFDWVALTMRLGDARGAECDAGHVFGRAAAYPVIDQRGKPLVVGVRNVAVWLMRYRSSLPSAGSVVGSRHRRSRSRTCDRHS